MAASTYYAVDGHVANSPVREESVTVLTKYFAASVNGPSQLKRSISRSAASWSENTSHTPSQARMSRGQSPHKSRVVSDTYGVAVPCE